MSANGWFWFFKTVTQQRSAVASALTLLLSSDNLLKAHCQAWTKFGNLKLFKNVLQGKYSVLYLLVHKLSKAIFWLFFVVQKFKNEKNTSGIFFDLIDHIWACAEIWPPAAIDQNIDHAKKSNVTHHLKGFNELINFLKRSGCQISTEMDIFDNSLHQTSSPGSNNLNLVELFSNFKTINKIPWMGLRAANRCSEKPAILPKMSFFTGTFQGFWL